MCRKRKTAMERCRKRQKSEPVPDQKTEQSQSERSKKRNLEDLWQHVFSTGTEWDNMDAVYNKHKCDFSNLEAAFEQGGELYNKKVFLFGSTESQGIGTPTLAPVVVAVVSPFPPSDKIGIKSVQREEQIVPMKQMKMDWIPYIPLDKRLSQLERLKNPQIFILTCTQRKAALRNLKIQRLKDFEYCLPYFYNPLLEDDFIQSTNVSILYPIDPKPPVIVEFDWETDEVEEFIDDLIEMEVLPADEKERFKEFVKEEVRKAKRRIREERKARKKAREEKGGVSEYENLEILSGVNAWFI